MNTWKKRGILIGTVIVIIGAAAGLVRMLLILKNRARQEIEYQKILADENVKLLHVMSEWMKTKTNGRTISDYLIEKGYYNVAIYGMGILGDCLFNELRHGKVVVKYAIDENAEEIYSQVELYKPSDTIPAVDAIIMTDLSKSKNIRKQLKCEKEYPEIVFLEEIIMDM